MRQRIHLGGVSREIEGQEWQGEDLVRIGRDAHAEVRLGDTSVSRCHAELSFVEPLGWFIRDRASTNGTFLNGVRIGAEDRQVQERDLLQIGNLVLQVVGIHQSDSACLESSCGMLRVEATTQNGFEEALDAVARTMAPHPRTGAQLVGLLRDGHALHQHDSHDELLKKNFDQAVRTVSVRSGALLLLDAHTGELRVHAATWHGNGPHALQCFSRTLAQRCLTRGESLLSRDVREDVGLRQSGSAARANMRSIVCALVRSPTRKLGVLHLARGVQDKPFTVFELHLADAIAANIAGSIESARFFLAKQRSWFIQTVIALAQTIELRDPCTAGHGRRVTKYALILADALGLPAKQRRRIEIGSRLHDIGKIGIRDSVLQKKGRLSAEEYQHMQSHTVKGAAILAAVPELALVLPIIRNHHERWDGRGYPDRLVAEEIPLEARIVAVADAFDAMTSHRPYRDGLSIDESLDQLQRGAGTQFDPKCSQAFVSLRRRLAKMIPSRQPAAAEVVEPAADSDPTDVETECAVA
jgi:HD-GYP domain-containing protein (c-di-GMP phosphodiesterase class II)